MSLRHNRYPRVVAVGLGLVILGAFLLSFAGTIPPDDRHGPTWILLLVLINSTSGVGGSAVFFAYLTELRRPFYKK